MSEVSITNYPVEDLLKGGSIPAKLPMMKGLNFALGYRIHRKSYAVRLVGVFPVLEHLCDNPQHIRSIIGSFAQSHTRHFDFTQWDYDYFLALRPVYGVGLEQIKARNFYADERGDFDTGKVFRVGKATKSHSKKNEGRFDCQYFIGMSHLYQRDFLSPHLDRDEPVSGLTDNFNCPYDLDSSFHLVPKDKMKTQGFRLCTGGDECMHILNTLHTYPMDRYPCVIITRERPYAELRNMMSKYSSQLLLFTNPLHEHFRDNPDYPPMPDFLFQALLAKEEGGYPQYNMAQICGFYALWGNTWKITGISRKFDLTAWELQDYVLKTMSANGFTGDERTE